MLVIGLTLNLFRLLFYEGGLKSSSADYDAMVESELFFSFFLKHSLPCGPHTSSSGVAALGFLWYKSSRPDPQKSPELQICNDLYHWSDTASQPSVFSCWGTENKSDGAKS